MNKMNKSRDESELIASSEESFETKDDQQIDLQDPLLNRSHAKLTREQYDRDRAFRRVNNSINGHVRPFLF